MPSNLRPISSYSTIELLLCIPFAGDDISVSIEVVGETGSSHTRASNGSNTGRLNKLVLQNNLKNTIDIYF